MNVTSKITVDLTRPNIGGRVNAVQGDGNTRQVEITLLAGGVPWTPPEGVEVAIAYMQPSGTKGMYNLLADGTAAISITGNVATVILAPQMLTVSGTVQASLVFNDSQLNRLTTFPFAVSVTSNPAAGAQKTEDYIRLQWLEDKLDEYLKKFEGGVDEATVQRIVNEYLAANPPTVTETDPTVPAWAKEPQKPTYTAAEVGALPDTYTPPNQTAQQVGADPAGTAASAVSQHNTDTTAHNDLRLALQGLSDRINAALDSDDTTLDQMSEVVAYIKSNKSLIDAITTSKVSVADIVNDLVTNVADKPLSAAQGVALKSLIEELRTLIPDEYTLPTATETTLGGVKPVTATETMTQPVGVTADGRLVTKPGGDGSGIAVTGAKVGQTVKIAAVDDGGVPTAWEAVDFPSGVDEPTGALELLVDHTVTAAEASAVSITFTKDKWPLIDGQKFVLVRVVKPTGVNGWCKLKAGNKIIASWTGSTNICQVCGAMVANGMWIFDSSEGNNLASGAYLSFKMWMNYKAYSEIYEGSYAYYDSFTLYSFTAAWPEGTTIEIYGVK